MTRRGITGARGRALLRLSRFHLVLPRSARWQSSELHVLWARDEASDTELASKPFRLTGESVATNIQTNDGSNSSNTSSTVSGENTSSNPVAGFTANAFLLKPATAQRNWDAAINANSDTLDGMSAIGQLVVTSAELPSATLNIRVTGGSYGKGDGTIGSYAGVAAFALPASSTSCVWLTDPGVLTASPTFPTTAHVRLAQVVDRRINCSVCC